MSSLTSWLRMCDSSCAMTACSSSSSSFSIIPCDRVTVYVRSLIPLANAFRESSYMMFIFGHFHALAHAEVLDQIVDTFAVLSLQ